MSSIRVCCAGREENIEIRAGESLLALLRGAGYSVPAACGGRGKCGKCRVKVNGVPRLACKLQPADGDRVELPESGAAAILTRGQVQLNCVPGQSGLAAAVDLGTTTVVVRVLDLATGKAPAEQAAMNAQAGYGADVISRIAYITEHAAGLRELQSCIRGQVQGLLEAALQECGREKSELKHIVLVGNTVMQHIFAGLNPGSIAVAPFTPQSLFRELGTDALDGIPLRYAPCVAGYVGGDITAGLLAAGVFEQDGEQLFLDIGTNGEMALGGKHGVLTCAVASGPAFEGAAITCGMPGLKGAVSHVRYENGFLFDIIGGGTAKGICGSGLVELAAVLAELGVITPGGRLLPPEEAPAGCGARLRRDNEGNGCFYLTEEVFLTAADVRSLQLAKAAVAAGIRVLEETTGKQPESLQLAGGFGNYMNAEAALKTGMLPRVLSGHIRSIGNTALAGACILALDPEARERLLKYLEKTEYLELSGNAAFNRAYPECMGFE